MKHKIILLLFFIAFVFISGTAQNVFSCVLKNAETNVPLANVSVILKGSNPGTITDKEGKAKLDLSNGRHEIAFSSVGFQSKKLTLVFPLSTPDTVFTIMLKPEEKEIGEVIVSSSRTESGIENLPTKVEVLGAEEVNEEVGIKPGNIASLLGDVAGIQIQQTSAATGNVEMRVQGLPGKYTQLLKDGMPLFGGYSGTFSILQIPLSILNR